MDSLAVGWNGFEEICKQNSKGEEKGKKKQHATGDRFGGAWR